MLVKLKADKKDTFVAFGGGGRKNLGERDDLDKLAIIALESGNKSLLDLFEQPMPSLEDLKKQQTDAQLKNAPAVNKEAEQGSGPIRSEITPPPPAKEEKLK